MEAKELEADGLLAKKIGKYDLEERKKKVNKCLLDVKSLIQDADVILSDKQMPTGSAMTCKAIDEFVASCTDALTKLWEQVELTKSEMKNIDIKRKKSQ